jgi:hypothetical protein
MCPVCQGCHTRLHQRIKHPESWRRHVDRYAKTGNEWFYYVSADEEPDIAAYQRARYPGWDLDDLYRSPLFSLPPGLPEPALMPLPTRVDLIGNKDRTAMAIDNASRDAKHQSSAAQRRRPNVGTVEEYESAFNSAGLKDYHLKMLRAHAAAGTLTTTKLAEAAGWRGYKPANLHYGNLGKKIAKLIGLELKPRKNGTLIGIAALATARDEADESSGHFQWEIHNEVKEALHRLGLLQVGATAR